MLTTVLVLLTGLPSPTETLLRQAGSSPPSMSVHQPPDGAVRHLGVIVAAPHDGYDLHTGAIARDVANRLTAPAVVAVGYRQLSNRRFFNVNRPTGRSVSEDRKLGPETTSPEATQVFEQWLAHVTNAKKGAGIECDETVPLYVEIHGNSRTVNADGENVAVDVIEVATLGFTAERLRLLTTLWNDLRKSEPKLPPIAFDALHATYECHGQTVTFKYQATSAKRSGILQSHHVKQALHFELPRETRDTAHRVVVTEAIAALVAEAKAD